MKLSIVIPVFNEAQSLEFLHGELISALEKTSFGYEIIYVDDASCDGSLDILNKLSGDSVKVIAFEVNRGQSAALYAGFKACSGGGIITLDADGQNPPGEIIQLLKFYPDFDYVCGIRKARQDSGLKKAASVAAKVSRYLVLGDTTQDTGCSLRLFKPEILADLPFFDNFHRFFTFLVRAKGFSIKEVEVKHAQRKFGKSKHKTFKRLRQGLFDLGGVFWLKHRLINYKLKR
jgi:glycosyltransferase involved in cell wall biosynthesis